LNLGEYVALLKDVVLPLQNSMLLGKSILLGAKANVCTIQFETKIARMTRIFAIGLFFGPGEIHLWDLGIHRQA
jgi:hypothetical protein